MSQPTALYLRIDQKVRGPFSPELLTELAQSGVITPATEASASATGPWIPLQATEGCAEIFPVRPELGFKSQTFENANPASAPPVDHYALIAAANRPAPPPAKSGAQGTAGTPTANEVVEILRENARIQAQFEKPLDLTPRSNRRRVDYLILMILVNGFFIWRLLANRGDPTTMVYSFSGIVLFSVGITWVMYGVMDRY
jgi:hypothetical protein